MSKPTDTVTDYDISQFTKAALAISTDFYHGGDPFTGSAKAHVIVQGAIPDLEKLEEGLRREFAFRTIGSAGSDNLVPLGDVPRAATPAMKLVDLTTLRKPNAPDETGQRVISFSDNPGQLLITFPLTALPHYRERMLENTEYLGSAVRAEEAEKRVEELLATAKKQVEQTADTQGLTHTDRIPEQHRRYYP